MSATSKKLILLLVTVSLTLGIAEVLLRITGYGIIAPEMNFGVNTRLALDQGNFLADPDLFWKVPPHPLDAGWHFVQPDVPVPSRKTRPRVLVVGDSCSRISQKQPPYSKLLEDSLKTRNIEVWNGSVPGYTVWQGRAWLGKQLLDLEPDLTILYFGWNDHWRATGITDRNYASRLNPWRPRLLLLLKRAPAESPLRIPLADYGLILQDMVQQLQEAGSRVILLAGPENLTPEAKQRLVQSGYLIPGDNAVTLHRQYLEVLRQIARTSGADLLDAQALFQGSQKKSLMMRDGIHLTDLGHQKMASLLAQKIRHLQTLSPKSGNGGK